LNALFVKKLQVPGMGRPVGDHGGYLFQGAEGKQGFPVEFAAVCQKQEVLQFFTASRLSSASKQVLLDRPWRMDIPEAAMTAICTDRFRMDSQGDPPTKASTELL